MIQHIRRSRIAKAAKDLVRTFLVAFALSLAGGSARAETIDLRAYAGRVVYLDFWASWCGPCKQSFPWMDSLQQAFANRGLVVLAVNLDKDRALADKFLQSHPVAFTVAFDPTGKSAKSYNVKAMPTSFLIGKDGQIWVEHQGFHEELEDQYVAQVRDALGAHQP